jgi:hypothetical protein
MFEIGQFVFTKKEIRGWFNFSLLSYIPSNYQGKIVGYIHHCNDVDSAVYEVEFGKEFGTYHVNHCDLKLG